MIINFPKSHMDFKDPPTSFHLLHSLPEENTNTRRVSDDQQKITNSNQQDYPNINNQ